MFACFSFAVVSALKNNLTSRKCISDIFALGSCAIDCKLLAPLVGIARLRDKVEHTLVKNVLYGE